MTPSPRAIRPSINGWNAEFLESEYLRWQRNPSGTPPDLAQFFQGFDLASSGTVGVTRGVGGVGGVGGGESDSSLNGSATLTGHSKVCEDRSQAAVANLIEAYRKLGHLCAAIDPFDRERPLPEPLSPQFHGLNEANLEEYFDAGSLSPDGSPITLRQIIEILDTTYCRSIGVEFSHVSDAQEWRWLADRMESTRNSPAFDKGQRAHILYQLHKAELFEKFCGKRYPGVKRFSLEGCESLIPLLDVLIEAAGEYEVVQCVMGMSHRGRLNVLTNIVGKTYDQIFTEFDDSWTEDAALGGGDVKYHRGYSANRVLRSGRNIWVCMASNPSHLESSVPVVMGRTRAKQAIACDTERRRVISIQIHGDAAFIAQGVVAESLNLSQLEGYTVGGTIHIIVNNQIGFTTGQEDARSTRYCTDIAKMLETPIFHVNAEDPEAVALVARLALDYRMAFHKDVFIDLQGYRLHGHNETDEAEFTQPLLYKEIKSKPSVLSAYAERLLAEKVISEVDREEIRLGLDEELDRAYSRIKVIPVDPIPDPGHRQWTGITGAFTFDPVETGVTQETLEEISAALGRWPTGFTPHDKLMKILGDRATRVKRDAPIDWGTAEALAYGSLLVDGTEVRLAGQDSRRGTFSHRHAALRDVTNASLYIPLNHIREPRVNKGEEMPAQATFSVYDSPLSEFACLGFEYGYSLASPGPLVIWEAQFGDFVNGAQVIIDQYMAAAEAKWQRWSGLTLLLPHGYEGQGPEHSSARLERFLKLTGGNNIQVCYPSTPAQFFHLIRRQAMRTFRKPLVVMSPKSLLRFPACTSQTADLTSGSFQEVLDDPQFAGKGTKKRARRVILCSGKVYYDLVARREATGRDDLSILRLEQIYPLHVELLKSILHSYPKELELVWVQEEPQNMGAWGHVFITLNLAEGWELPYIGRPASATPATGSHAMHAVQLDDFLSDAVAPLPTGAKAVHAGAH